MFCLNVPLHSAPLQPPPPRRPGLSLSLRCLFSRLVYSYCSFFFRFNNGRPVVLLMHIETSRSDVLTRPVPAGVGSSFLISSSLFVPKARRSGLQTLIGIITITVGGPRQPPIDGPRERSLIANGIIIMRITREMRARDAISKNRELPQ